MSDGAPGVRFDEVPVEELPVDEAVNRLLTAALSLPASDLFITAHAEQAKVFVRHLGVMRLIAECPTETGRHLINHVKASAGIDFGQARWPQDGRWIYFPENGRKIDLRINTMPTLHGEDLAIRFLLHGNERLQLACLGFHRSELDTLVHMLNKPGGLILVTGPTGSGKTTTLYACLHYLNNGTRKINTIEDPVEYEMEGVRQSQVNLKADLDFPELLRGVLRQGPDVIMIGEIRDPITAETAVRAANSGHIVLATLHSPVAATAVDSMRAFGVHPHFLASSLQGVVTQRLVRKLCDRCKISFDLSGSPHTFDDVRTFLSPGEGETIYAAAGCDECHHEGFFDRTGVFEVMPVTTELRQMILQGRPARDIRQQSVTAGMLDLRRSALLKVAKGITSTEEVIRTIPTEHLLAD